MRVFVLLVLLGGFLFQISGSRDSKVLLDACEQAVDVNGGTIAERFVVNKGFRRDIVSESSYAHFLRTLPLKAAGTEVRYYDGQIKANNRVYCGVVDMDLDAMNLQQCADAVMRLRAEYLYEQKRFDDIHFNYLSDGKPRYFTEFAKGEMSYRNFRKYMIQVFSYANTRSLHDELMQVSDPGDIMPGDIFIQKGNPYGHAVIVVDVAINPVTLEKQFILAQSYMPAQDTQILINPNIREESPWYSSKQTIVQTPEWTFQWKDLRRFSTDKA